MVSSVQKSMTVSFCGPRSHPPKPRATLYHPSCACVWHCAVTQAASTTWGFQSARKYSCDQDWAAVPTRVSNYFPYVLAIPPVTPFPYACLLCSFPPLCCCLLCLLCSLLTLQPQALCPPILQPSWAGKLRLLAHLAFRISCGPAHLS